MQLPDGYILLRKDVKHARLRVSEDGQVRVIIPNTFSEADIDGVLKKKKVWIEKNKRFFEGKSKIVLPRNGLLLFGNRYHYFYDLACGQKVVVDDVHKTVRAKRNLLDTLVQERWYKKVAKNHLVLRTEELAANLNFTYNGLYIRSQKKKWGNCSKDKNISLNWRLIKAPPFVIDYLIVHELVHTQVMNHSYKFWTLLRSHFPDYKAAINWLDKYGNSL